MALPDSSASAFARARRRGRLILDASCIRRVELGKGMAKQGGIERRLGCLGRTLGKLRVQDV